MTESYDFEDPTLIEPMPALHIGGATARPVEPAVPREPVHARSPYSHVEQSVPDESGVRPRWDSIEVDVSDLHEPDPTAFDIDLTELERGLARAAADASVPVSITGPSAEDPTTWHAEAPPSFAPIMLEASIASSSDSNFYRDLEGKIGVFLATYDPATRALAIGERVWLSVHLPNGMCIESLARVEHKRDDLDGGWPGVGLRMLSLDERDHLAIVGFMRQREPLFY